jgi:hypothetical protein
MIFYKFDWYKYVHKNQVYPRIFFLFLIPNLYRTNKILHNYF